MDERQELGLATLRLIRGADAEAPLVALNDLAPDLVRFAIGFAYGEVLSRPTLDLKTRQLCTVAALGAMGTAPFQLQWHVIGSLDLGWQPAELVDAVMFTGAMTASPAVARSLGVVRASLETRGTSPESLRIVEQATACWHQGVPWENRAALDGRTQSLISVAALTAVANAPDRLEARIADALRTNVPRAEVIEVIEQMAIYAGFPAALNGVAAARKAFGPDGLT